MWQKYISILILLSIVGVSSYKINQHLDDEEKTKLATYSTIAGVSSALILYFIYLIYTHLTPKDKVIDAVLNDFLKLNEA